MIQFNGEEAASNTDDVSNKGESNEMENAIELNRRVVNLPPSVDEEKIKNLELENEELKAKIQMIEQSSEGEAANKMKKELADLRLELEVSQKESLEKAREVEKLKKQTQVVILQKEKMEKKQKEMEEKIKELEKKNEDVKNTNNDLIENLSQKEDEFKKESQMNQREINELKLKIEELEDDRKEVFEAEDEGKNFKYEQLLGVLNNASMLVDSIIMKLATFINRSHEDMVTFCLLLESIGLMLALDGKGGFAVQRVKGLRAKKKKLLSAEMEKTTEERISDSTIEDALLEVVAEDVVQNSYQSMEKLQLTDLTDLSRYEDKDIEMVETENEGEQSQTSSDNGKALDHLSHLMDRWKDLDKSKQFNEFMTNTFLDRKMLIEKVFGRFNDVETLARRLQKEKNAQRVDNTSLRYELGHRLAIRNLSLIHI